MERHIALCSEGHFSEYYKQNWLPVEKVFEMKDNYSRLWNRRTPLHSGSEGTDSLSRESDQKLAALYCKTNRKLPFLKAAKGCFENSMK